MNKKLKLWELNRVSEEDFKEQEKFPLVIVLDNIRSASNTGSVFRTSDAFNVKELILGGITPVPPNREIQKTAIGATESIQWRHEENTIMAIQNLKNEGYQICVVEQTEQTTLLQNFQISIENKYVVVFGNEVNGVDQAIIDIADTIVEVPQFGTKHSLNVSVCAGVVLWEMTKKFI